MCDGCISDVDLPLRILLVALVLLQRLSCSGRCCKELSPGGTALAGFLLSAPHAAGGVWLLAVPPKLTRKPCRVPAGGNRSPCSSKPCCARLAVPLCCTSPRPAAVLCSPSVSPGCKQGPKQPNRAVMGPGSIVLCCRRVPELPCAAVNVLVNVSSLTAAWWLRERAEPRTFTCCWSQPKNIPWSASLCCMPPAVWLSHQHVLVYIFIWTCI